MTGLSAAYHLGNDHDFLVVEKKRRSRRAVYFGNLAEIEPVRGRRRARDYPVITVL